MPATPPVSIAANVVDILNRTVFPAIVVVSDGKIASIGECRRQPDTYLLPGFVDAHVHIESSMLVPSEFAKAAVVHGTVATVSDPHEIGNVLGSDGVAYMLENAAGVPFKFFFGAPSCVPATSFETAGAEINAREVATLLDDPRILYLSEMMNFPGVLHGDAEVLAKIRAARERGKPVDGHAPGLRGESAKSYIAAGISTDHECFTKAEALEKLSYAAKIIIREGSAARNFDELHSLLNDSADRCMLCSDDKHPDELLTGHINVLAKRAVVAGIDVMNVLRSACVTPVLHYHLDVGLLRPGDDADFVEVNNLRDFRVLRTFVRGQLVAQDGESLISTRPPRVVNQFTSSQWRPQDFRVRAQSGRLNAIEALDGQLITRRAVVEPTIVDGLAVADPSRDLLKIAVVNRYRTAPPAVAFIRNFGLQRGAIASSVAHDCHNVIAVGTNDEDLAAAVNLVMEAGGGLAVADAADHRVLALPIAGLMSTESCQKVGRSYEILDRQVKALGSRLRSPFMTLSFMALLVIPELKLSDRGLFDGNRFEFAPLFE